MGERLVLLQEAEPRKSGWEKLDSEHQAAVVISLCGLIALGVLAIVLIWLGGRAWRRWMDSGPRLGPTGVDLDDWAQKRLNDSLDDDEP